MVWTNGRRVRSTEADANDDRLPSTMSPSFTSPGSERRDKSFPHTLSRLKCTVWILEIIGDSDLHSRTRAKPGRKLISLARVIARQRREIVAENDDSAEDLAEIDMSPLFGSDDMFLDDTLLPCSAMAEPFSPVASRFPIHPKERPTEKETDIAFLQNLRRLQEMSGAWHIVKAQSDGYEQLADLLDLCPATRTTLQQFINLDVTVLGHKLLQAGLAFKTLGLVSELDLVGNPVTLRSSHKSRISVTVKTLLTSAGYNIKISWEGTFPGGLIETMEFSDDGRQIENWVHVYLATGCGCDVRMRWERVENQLSTQLCS